MCDVFFVTEIKHAPERAQFTIPPGHPSDSDVRILITVLSESVFWQFFRTWHRLSRKASKFVKFWQRQVWGPRYQRHDCSGCCILMDVTNQVELQGTEHYSGVKKTVSSLSVLWRGICSSHKSRHYLKLATVYFKSPFLIPVIQSAGIETNIASSWPLSMCIFFWLLKLLYCT